MTLPISKPSMYIEVTRGFFQASSQTIPNCMEMKLNVTAVALFSGANNYVERKTHHMTWRTAIFTGDKKLFPHKLPVLKIADDWLLDEDDILDTDASPAFCLHQHSPWNYVIGDTSFDEDNACCPNLLQWCH